jgi:ABC-2 type transport system permease protein
MFKTILNLTLKELVQLFRDRVLLAFLIAAPMLQLVLIAQSSPAGIRNEKLAVWDQDRSTLSQQLISGLDNANEFQLAFRADNYEALQDLVKRGQARVAVIIPPHFERDAMRRDVGTTVAVFVDATNVVVASNILTALDGAVAELSQQALAADSPTRIPGGVDLKIDAEFNPTLNTRWTTLPATLAFIT